MWVNLGTVKDSETAMERLFEKNHRQDVMTLSVSRPEMKKKVFDVCLEQICGRRVNISKSAQRLRESVSAV